MIIKQDISLEDFSAWSGAVSTLDRIIEENKCDELEAILEDLFPDGMEETELNDLLWFDSEQVYEWLGISDDEEIDEEIEKAESYLCFENTEDFDEFCNENTCRYCKYEHCLSINICKENFYKDKEVIL